MTNEESTPQPKLVLCDQDPAVVEAWKLQFLKRPEVEILTEDPITTSADALLLPGNSFGFLAGGLELRTIEQYGWEIQDELRDTILTDFDGELLVGQAVILRKESLPWALVYAPVWRTPAPLEGSVNVFLAARAAFLALSKDEASPPDTTLAIPALGVGDPGQLAPAVSARQVRYAYEMATGLRGPGAKNLSQCTRRQRKLQALPGANRTETQEV